MITCIDDEKKPCFILHNFSVLLKVIQDKIVGKNANIVDAKNLATMLSEVGYSEFEKKLEREYMQYNKEGENKIKFSRNQARLSEVKLIDTLIGVFALMLLHQYSHYDCMGKDGQAGIAIGEYDKGDYPGTNPDPTYCDKQEVINKINKALHGIKMFYTEMLDYKYSTNVAKQLMSYEFNVRKVEENVHFKKAPEDQKKSRKKKEKK